MTFWYRLWGLDVASDTSLHEWPIPPIPQMAPDAAADVRLRLEPDPAFWRDLEAAPVAFTRVVGGDEQLIIRRFRDGWAWQYPDEALFHVSEDGDEVRAAWPSHYVVEDALTYLVGPVFGFVLRRKGIPSLHAGSVVIDGAAVAFTGGPGAGKSTLTAELVGRGFAMLGDDVAALQRAPNGFLVRPSAPLVKLWEDSAKRSGDLPFVSPTWPKRLLAVAPETFCAEPAPLRAVYLLGHEPGAVGPAEALAVLSANIYVHYARDPQARLEDLDFFAELVETVPVRGLARAPSLDAVGARVDNLFEDLRRCC